ncbi:MAG: DUF1329 domain-containing protein [Myxococcota bacterium]|nr:DUF1329 domain-containing protein [Myxococcota bacterium]
MTRLALLAPLAAGALLALATALPGPARAAELPPEGRCPDATGARGPEGPGEDEAPPLFRPGDVLGLHDLLALGRLFPPEIWSWREVFFHEGMRLEIGACHRRYPVADFYREATERFSGDVRLDEDGNLHGYVAGQPFPWRELDADDPAAGTRWAWNYLHRYVGAGPVGRFRILDLPGRVGSEQIYEGDFFWLRTAHRADLAVSGYRVPEADESVWVAGGRFDEPFSARHLAWRQLRPLEAERDFKEPDDTFVYVPTMRKPRRAASSWVDGIFTPRYTVSGDSGGGPVPFGAGGSSIAPNVESIQPTAGLSIAATEDIRRGFTGLALRPNGYAWKVLGEQEVLAPLNAREDGWPLVENRNYGPSGLSVASDRWDLRQAVVIEGLARRRVDGVAAVVLWIDVQTAQPLYVITKRKNGLLLDVGILVHRFSGDRPGYPPWPGGEEARVFDPVAASFYFVPGGGAGWRRESYDVRSVPLSPKEIRRRTSTSELTKGR